MKDGGMDWGRKKADAKGGKKEESKKAEVKKTEKVEEKAEPKKGELEKTDAVESKKVNRLVVLRRASTRADTSGWQ